MGYWVGETMKPLPHQQRSPLLAVEDLCAAYGRKEILCGVSFGLAEAEIVVLLGGNGSGKSTVLRTIAGVLTPTSGKVLLRNQDVTTRLPHEMQRLGLGYLVQGGRVFPSLSVGENIDVCSRSASSSSASHELVFPQLESLWSRRAGLLSGGERQMLAIEMVLRLGPEVLLLDEPSAGLAPPLVREILNKVAQFATKRNCAVLLVEQNAEEGARVAHRKLVLADGRISAPNGNTDNCDPFLVRGV